MWTGKISCEHMQSKQIRSLPNCRSKWDFLLGVNSFRVSDIWVDLTFFFFLQCHWRCNVFVVAVPSTICTSFPIKTVYCFERTVVRFYPILKLYPCSQLWSHSVHMVSRNGKKDSTDLAVLKPDLQLIMLWLLLLFTFADFEWGAFLWLPLEGPILTLDKHPISEAWYNSL